MSLGDLDLDLLLDLITASAKFRLGLFVPKLTADDLLGLLLFSFLPLEVLRSLEALLLWCWWWGGSLYWPLEGLPLILYILTWLTLTLES